MKFNELISIIKETDNFLQQKVYLAINQSLTIKNWLTGFYIVEFEQNGEDRAKYGEKLLTSIAKECSNKNLKGYSYSNLKYFRQFYLVYPRIGQSVITFFETNNFPTKTIRQSVIGELNIPENQKFEIGQSVIGEFTIANLIKQKTEFIVEDYSVAPEVLLKRTSYTHLIELMQIAEPLKRAFYEIECIKGNWSVRELQRQIGSLLFERTGFSTNKEKMIELANQKSNQFLPENIIRDPYIFEFLGLKQNEVLPENQFEDLLIAHLQEFLMELGKGFCFEARQKRITIDNRHFYIDLVFYHKVLKCNIIIELKTRKFEHSDASQLRVYLNYYRKNEMLEGDNLPIGILLCTDKSEELVEYATTGVDEQMFISKYSMELPTEKQLKDFIIREKRQFGLE